MRCVPVRIGPGFLASQHRPRISEAFRRYQALERGQPMMIVTGAVIRLAAILSRFQLGRQLRGPLFPRKMALLEKSDGERERLRFPARQTPALLEFD